jgi:hypothetical protein
MKIVRNITVAIITFAIMEQSFGQQKQLTGQIVDATDGSPLPGVSIVIKGTKKGVASDVNGKYQIAVNEQDTLVFSSVGFEQKSIPQKDIKPVMNLEESIQGLTEVVVVGYGTTHCGRLGGVSISRYMTDYFPEKSFKGRFKTDLKVLGNPTVSEEAIIVSQLHEKVEIEDPEERAEAMDWYANNGFQNIESVVVYNLSGQRFPVNFHKINDGKININLTNVPVGMHFVRITYSNERSVENGEVSVAKIWVLK